MSTWIEKQNDTRGELAQIKLSLKRKADTFEGTGNLIHAQWLRDTAYKVLECKNKLEQSLEQRWNER